MQRVTFGDALRQDKNLFRLAEQATKYLQESIGESSARVRAHWDLSQDAHRGTVVTLRIHDDSGEMVEATFAPSELSYDAYMSLRMNHLWGDMLAVYSDAQHRKVLELVRQLEGS